MSDTSTPPPEEPVPPPTTTAVDAGQARDAIEQAAYGVFVAALLWYALHGDEEPGDGSLLRQSANRVASTMWWARPRLSAHKPPRASLQDRNEWIDAKAADIVKIAQDDAGAHYDTVFKRIRKADPHATDAAVRSAFRLDHAWSKAAARSMATRLSSETALDMKEQVEVDAGEKFHSMWISRGDPKVRKLHRDLHGRVRPLGTPFHTWPDGQTLSYPGDPAAPIESWINCRCALMLVPAKDAKLAEEVFKVPEGDFDVPVAASGVWSAETRQAEADLRSEKIRGYTSKV